MRVLTHVYLHSTFNTQCKPPTIAVTGFAQAFVGDMRIAKANIRVLENEQQLTSSGAIIYNLLPSQIPYTLTAEKHGKVFSSVNFICRAGAFINLSPPYSPTVKNGP